MSSLPQQFTVDNSTIMVDTDDPLLFYTHHDKPVLTSIKATKVPQNPSTAHIKQI